MTKKFKVVVTHYSGMVVESCVEELSEEDINKVVQSFEDATEYIKFDDSNKNMKILKSGFLKNSVITIVVC